MDKGEQQPLNPPGSNDNGDDGDELAGSTLEDYFAMHKVSGHVSHHLLNIPAENDVMAAENVDNEDSDKPDLKGEARIDQDSYEDDYESETASPKADIPSDLAGMSLSDYLHVKEDDKAEAQEKLSRAGSLRMLPPQIAASAKKPTLISDVSGMSLDRYLGASVQGSGENSEEKKHAARADKKPSPQVKRKGKQTESNAVNSPDSSLTPFQRRQKRKEKAKAKQQRNTGAGLSVSKTILMAEAASSSPTILSVRDREKRKNSLTAANASIHSHHASHHGPHSSVSNFQSPLPKLAVSPSIRSLNHKDHDTQDNAEKLPPL
ncbi:Hypothetical protein PHPALM_20243 [Phytophthora palmivora]|uniref:Uncharacterized protein n=1 Tax=Phytophthora palmivora TaxID=4796 RepID=A0A2P4XFD6_9STRA|nr:Hypothetical protein PHPALM_20243 [Phytophthora palmivora]